MKMVKAVTAIPDINSKIGAILPDSSVLDTRRLDAAKEFDDFIYATAHSLRGPLATLKGLMHLAGCTDNPEEIAYLIKEMKVFAERLDEKLHQLIYVAESDKYPASDIESLSIDSLYQSLSTSAKEASVDFPLDFRCNVLDRTQLIEKGNIVFSMLENLVLFFSQQSKTPRNVLILDAHASSCATEIMIRAKGFSFSKSLIEKLENVNFGYSQILNFPELINYYAAKKIMMKLNGNVQFMLIAANEVVVVMTIPRDVSLPLK